LISREPNVQKASGDGTESNRPMSRSAKAISQMVVYSELSVPVESTVVVHTSVTFNTPAVRRKCEHVYHSTLQSHRDFSPKI